MLKVHIAPCQNNFYLKKKLPIFYRNISTASFNMQKILKNIIARCVQKPKSSLELLPTGTLTQSGNRRRRLRELRRREWGDLWWEHKNQQITLVRHKNSFRKCLHSFRNNIMRFLCFTIMSYCHVTYVSANINMSFFLSHTTSVSLFGCNHYMYVQVPSSL